MFDHLVHRFLNKIFESKPPIHTVPKKVVYFCLPFTGSHSLQIRTQINRLCNAAYPHLNIRFFFRSSKRISSFFPFKDKVPTFLRSGVVYLFDAVSRVVCGSNHAPFTHQSIGTPGTHSYNRTAVIQSGHV